MYAYGIFSDWDLFSGFFDKVKVFHIIALIYDSKIQITAFLRSENTFSTPSWKLDCKLEKGPRILLFFLLLLVSETHSTLYQRPFGGHNNLVT